MGGGSLDRLDKNGINFISLKEKFDTSTAAGRLVIHFFAALTQFERELIRERTMAGLSSKLTGTPRSELAQYTFSSPRSLCKKQRKAPPTTP